MDEWIRRKNSRTLLIVDDVHLQEFFLLQTRNFTIHSSPSKFTATAWTAQEQPVFVVKIQCVLRRAEDKSSSKMPARKVPEEMHYSFGDTMEKSLLTEKRLRQDA